MDHTIWHTILDEDVQALLDKQSGVEDDEAETEGQDVITRADLEKGAYRSLMLEQEVSAIQGDDQTRFIYCRQASSASTSASAALTKPSSCSWSNGLIGFALPPR